MPETESRRNRSVSRLEYATVVIATFVIAVHVLDDSFVHPEGRYVRPRPHRQWIVPVAACRRGGRIPRVRPGVRATVAFVVGLSGIVAGAEGWYYTLSIGASGDDYTGLVYDMAGQPKQPWRTDGGHTGGYAADPEEHERRVRAVLRHRAGLAPVGLRRCAVQFRRVPHGLPRAPAVARVVIGDGQPEP